VDGYINPLHWNSVPSRNAACRDFLLGILIFKRLNARRLYKSFGVKGVKVNLYSAWQISVAAGSNTWVCGRSLAGIAGSNLVSCECCLLPGIGLGDGLITCTGESYRV
jgi:hypothetical protein